MGCVVMDGGVGTKLQLVAIVPWLMMGPMIVPQPDRVALLEIVRPSANKCVPPSNWKVAALVPSPITNGIALLTVVPLEERVPPLNIKRPAALVRRRLSVTKLPPLKVTVPFG